MKIEQIKVSMENALSVMVDKEVYVIKYLGLFDHCIMRPATECSLKDIMDENALVVRVTKG